ncbi:T9SS type A sorting domain-containing protein [Psychroserpens luteus]|uniref:T9SS type A sorting domain-containing protein n=1 Tax=Psychroserpens luteus TaxID=1434066 RepID=A0ABW5ZU80_9FLAO|nr:T9SS type A sorting domain-containing protein [Psychroserpens luteus]
MKLLFTSFLFLFTILIGHSQIIDIPDANFKNRLLESDNSNSIAKDLNGNSYQIDVNNDGEIQINEALSVSYLNLSSSNILSIEGIEYFTNLSILYCNHNGLTNIDLSSNLLLTELTLNFNDLGSLDISNNYFLTSLQCSSNYNLVYFNIKNGNSFTQQIEIVDVPSLAYMCIDDIDLPLVTNLINYEVPNLVANSYCSFTLGGESFIVEGENKVDTNLDGCDLNDYLYSNLKINIFNANFNWTYYTNASGNYSIPVTEGTNTLTPVFENSDYFSFPQNNITVSFPQEVSPYNQDFCIIPNGIHNDLEVFIIPITDAIPGFESTYKVVYRNIGNTMLTGNVNLDYSFDSDYMQYQSSIPSEISNINNVLSWDYIDLAPFETREIEVNFILNTPTNPNYPLNSGDELNFEATIYPIQDDETPNNNDFGLKQIVINSYDPNDITCLEGETIEPDDVDKYVHYMIRFENLGTANATNIVVKNNIDDTKFDINTLVPLDGSHDYYTRINTQNDVEFIFENINLPFDDATNDGYVLYKIKTLESLVLGDTFSNQAEIYFDFNAPIITNTYTTEIAEDNLSVLNTNLVETNIYPNPVNDILTIESEAVINSASIYDINGRAILTSKFNDASHQMDLSLLDSGIYFLKVFSNRGNETLKIIKE